MRELAACDLRPAPLSPPHPFTLSPCHLVTLSPCHLVTLSPCHPLTLRPQLLHFAFCILHSRSPLVNRNLDDLLTGCSRVLLGVAQRDAVYDLLPFDDLAKDRVLAVEIVSWRGRDEELRAAAVGL